MDGLQSLFIDRGRLLGVIDVDESFEGSAFALRFEEGTTLVVANETDDSIAMADLGDLQSLTGVLSHRQFEDLQSLLGTRTRSAYELRSDLSSALGWSQAVGKSPVWAWFLTNNLGVCDGIQVELADKSRKRTTVQLVVSASQMSIRLLAD